MRRKLERRRRGVLGVARDLIAVACLLAAAGTALAQEPGSTPPKDTIFARKILMDTIGRTMDEIETAMAESGKIDLGELREHADLISVMLMTFPHLFPGSTNQWTPDNPDRDAALDTYAAPEVWANFAEFYQRVAAASKLAFEASRAKRADFRGLIIQLRDACTGCHAAYLKTD
ncbi:MAG: cytochrome c [Proteobacteria bacterium]|nr:cytochrome c [Pseudomonadota bacterium]